MALEIMRSWKLLKWQNLHESTSWHFFMTIGYWYYWILLVGSVKIKRFPNLMPSDPSEPAGEVLLAWHCIHKSRLVRRCWVPALGPATGNKLWAPFSACAARTLSIWMKSMKCDEVCIMAWCHISHSPTSPTWCAWFKEPLWGLNLISPKDPGTRKSCIRSSRPGTRCCSLWSFARCIWSSWTMAVVPMALGALLEIIGAATAVWQTNLYVHRFF